MSISIFKTRKRKNKINYGDLSGTILLSIMIYGSFGFGIYYIISNISNITLKGSIETIKFIYLNLIGYLPFILFPSLTIDYLLVSLISSKFKYKKFKSSIKTDLNLHKITLFKIILIVWLILCIVTNLCYFNIYRLKIFLKVSFIYAIIPNIILIFLTIILFMLSFFDKYKKSV
jgi:hypothetical protein